MNLEEFKAQRSKRLTAADADIRPFVDKALNDFGKKSTWDDVVEGASVLWLEIFQAQAPNAFYEKALADFQQDLRDSLDHTTTPTDPADSVQIDRVTLWIGTYVVNNATYHGNRAQGKLTMRWVTMHDSSVRHIHAETDGQVVSVNGTFDVGGYKLHFPGEPVGPPEVWINCRCLLAVGRTRRASDTDTEEFTVMTASAVQTQVTDPFPDEEDGDGIHVAQDVDPEEIADDPETDDPDAELVDDLTEIPVHGVATVEGKPTGDGRMFANGALSTRELPLPIRFEFVGSHGGDTSMVDTIGTIDEVWMDGGKMMYRGKIIMSSDHGPEAVEGIIDGRFRGVSVEVDDVVMDVTEDKAKLKELFMGGELPEDKSIDDMSEAEIDAMIDDMVGDGTVPITTFAAARVDGFTMVPIPAFTEAYIALGHEFEPEEALAACGCTDGLSAEQMSEMVQDLANWEINELQGVDADMASMEFAIGFADIDEGKWDGSASNYTDEQYYAACVLHKNGQSTAKSDNALPIKTPDGKLSRAGVHAAASRINQVTDAPDAAIASAKSALRKAYKTLGEDAPDSITASAFAPGTHDGPGWITNPRATARIRRYWTHGKGAAKIRWGVPGDFNRCRKQLVKYVQNPDWLAGLCANMHKEAIGVWPGQEGGGRNHHTVQSAPTLAIIASAGIQPLDASAFANPNFTEPTRISIDDSGRITGHVAAWGVCHIGIAGICTTAPHSAVNYAHFATGVVRTTDGDVRVGQITMDTGHADNQLDARATAAHYDNTGAVVADVAIGEDDHGIWISGLMRQNATPEQIYKLNASGRLSGDWRRIGGGLELVAALAVNVQGFPLPANSLAASAGVQTSLVAAGIVESVTASSYQKLNDDERVAAISRNAVAEYIHQTKREERLASVAGTKKALRQRRLNAAREMIKIEE